MEQQRKKERGYPFYKTTLLFPLERRGPLGFRDAKTFSEAGFSLFWESTKVSHTSVFSLLTSEIRS